MGTRGRQSSTHLMEREGPEQARKEVKNLKLMLTCLRCVVACIITTFSSHAKERFKRFLRPTWKRMLSSKTLILATLAC